MFHRFVTRLITLALICTLALSLTPTTRTTALTGPTLTVNAATGQKPISRYIYGISFADNTLAQQLQLPVERYGGNAATRYNWQNDTANRASDWYFENIPDANSNPGALPNGSATDQFVTQDRTSNTKSVLTVPLIGWTPKDRVQRCGFSVAKYGAQQSTDPWMSDCGNGIKPDGVTKITNNDPTDTSVAITPTFVQQWITHLIANFGTAANGGVMFYSLDNESDIWFATHRDVHPIGASYDEMKTRTYQYAAAIKATDPTAFTLGPDGWGWSSFQYSGLDQQTCAIQNCWGNPPDQGAHGGIPFTSWYLQQMAAYEQANHVRILDYFDEHFYPQNGVALNSNVDTAHSALRLRSTRDLWDPSYTDESWIGTQVQLIPRMKSLVAANYPGTKVALTEYNWGALDKLNGALTQADILGILGREGADMAALWGGPAATDPGAYAFRMYLNYDGAGGRFGNVSVTASSADQSLVSIYGSKRTGDGSLLLMIINKDPSNSYTSTVSLSGFSPASTGQVYRYSNANLNAIVPQPNQPVTSSGFSATFPAYSITLVIIPPAVPLINSIGLFAPSTGTFYLRNNNSAGNADEIFPFGPVPSGLIPISGDWTGQGIKTIGLYDPSSSYFYLKNSNSAGNADMIFTFGPTNAGLLPIVGDWIGQGKDTIGVYSPSTGYFYLKNSNSAGNADLVFQFGPTNLGLIPIVGDWTNKGYDTVGLYSQANAYFYLKNNHGSSNADISFQYGPATGNGGAPATPVTGRWLGTGNTTIGVYVPANAYYYLKNTNAAGNADNQFQYGPGPNAGWKSVIGHW